MRLHVGGAILKRQGEQNRATYGSIGDDARIFGCSTRTMKRVAKTYRQQLDDTQGIDVKRRHQGKCGRPRKDEEVLVAKIQQIPQFKRSSISRLGHLSNVPKSTLQRGWSTFGSRYTGTCPVPSSKRAETTFLCLAWVREAQDARRTAGT